MVIARFELVFRTFVIMHDFAVALGGGVIYDSAFTTLARNGHFEVRIRLLIVIKAIPVQLFQHFI